MSNPHPFLHIFRQVFIDLGVDRSEQHLLLMNELVKLNAGFGFSEDLEKHINLLELKSGCLEDETIEVLESIP